jgi:hypothetical protein
VNESALAALGLDRIQENRLRSGSVRFIALQSIVNESALGLDRIQENSLHSGSVHFALQK